MVQLNCSLALSFLQKKESDAADLSPVSFSVAGISRRRVLIAPGTSRKVRPIRRYRRLEFQFCLGDESSLPERRKEQAGGGKERGLNPRGDFYWPKLPRCRERFLLLPIGKEGWEPSLPPSPKLPPKKTGARLLSHSQVSLPREMEWMGWGPLPFSFLPMCA